jgi:hypothetical protein
MNENEIIKSILKILDNADCKKNYLIERLNDQYKPESVTEKQVSQIIGLFHSKGWIEKKSLDYLSLSFEGKKVFDRGYDLYLQDLQDEQLQSQEDRDESLKASRMQYSWRHPMTILTAASVIGNAILIVWIIYMDIANNVLEKENKKLQSKNIQLERELKETSVLKKKS